MGGESPPSYKNLAGAGASGLVADWARSFRDFAGVGTKADLLAVTPPAQQPLLSLPRVKGGNPLASYPRIPTHRYGN